ncbi:hypothetical protein [Anaeromicrobium sediminis]|uniref:hypothetical protein n=1 Tax=Anaeromicrobium sediminis TaxID=1478221 RepID=UPI0015950E90|nr:hypothetical protein [Anaeromicrobium sediminis]
MAVYLELKEAIENIVQEIEETNEFKRSFSKLIENFLDNSYRDDDIREVLNLVSLKGEE